MNKQGNQEYWNRLLLTELPIPKEEIKEWLKAYAAPYKELMSYYRCAITEKIKVSKKEILNSFVKYEIDSYKSSIGIRVIGSIWAGIWLLSAIFVMTNSGPDSIYLALGFFVIGFLPILFIIRSMIKHKKRVKEIKAEELYFKREIVDRKEIKTEKITYSDAPDELVTSYLVNIISDLESAPKERK